MRNRWIQLKRPFQFPSGHKLSHIDPAKSYFAERWHAFWVTVTDDIGQEIHVSKSQQREFFNDVQTTDEDQA